MFEPVDVFSRFLLFLFHETINILLQSEFANGYDQRKLITFMPVVIFE